MGQLLIDIKEFLDSRVPKYKICLNKANNSSKDPVITEMTLDEELLTGWSINFYFENLWVSPSGFPPKAVFLLAHKELQADLLAMLNTQENQDENTSNFLVTLWQVQAARLSRPV